MIDYMDVMERDEKIKTASQEILTYLREQRELVPVDDLLAEVSKRCHVAKATVATGVSRVADQLEWNYSRGAVRFRLRG